MAKEHVMVGTAPLSTDAQVELLRKMLLEVGRRLVEGRSISSQEDIFWLEEAEAQAAAEALDQVQPLHAMQPAISQRKAVWNAEKHVAPPTMLPVGSDVSTSSVIATGIAPALTQPAEDRQQ